MKYNFDEIIDRKNTNSENVDGWRPYIFKCGPEKVFPYADDEFIRMWVADMEFAVAPEIRQAIIDRVERKILGYTIVSDNGYYEALLKWCKDRYDWEFKKDELVFSPGVIPALYQLVEDLVAKDEKVLTMTPAYGFFLHACEYNNVELIESPLKITEGNFEIDFDDFDKKAADPKVKVLMLCNPHNPSGRIWTEDELKHIAETAEKNNLWIISDEIHCDLIRTGLSHIPMGKIMPDYDRLITTMSASKTFNLAGMLFSNIIIRNKEERERFQDRDKNIGAANPLSIAAHKAAYEQGGQWLSELKAYVDESFKMVDDFLSENIPDARFTIPEATYFAWVDMSRVLPDVEDLPLFFANNAGVLLEGGDGLFVGNAQGYIRLNLAMPKATIKEGLCRMAEAIKNHK
ncbi:MAG: PatB family C-S lyase [Firmicutes bacterium]|nr:PatB family C-S lyase [Bacillota bacterium]